VPDLSAATTALAAVGFHVLGSDDADWRGVVLPFEHVELTAAAAPGLAGIGLASRAEAAVANDASPSSRRVLGPPALTFAETSVPAGELPVSLTRTLTPAALRPPEALRHACGAVALRAATCVVTAPDEVGDALRPTVGPDALTRTDAIVTLRLSNAVLLLTTPSDVELIHPDLPDHHAATAAPWVAALTFEVADIERAAAAVGGDTAAMRRRPDGSLGVTAAALGLSLEFRRAA